LLEQNLTLEQEEGQRRREEWQPYCHRLRKAAPHEVDKAAGDFDTGYRRDKQSPLLLHMFDVSWLEEKNTIDARSGVAPV